MLKVKILIETDELTTVLDAAKFLGVHFATVYRWIKAGRLLGITIGNQVYLHTSEVKALRNKTNEAQEKAP